jgi:predicted DNA-binding protein
VDEELRRRMSSIEINWSEYIREAIRQRIELKKRRNAAKNLLEELKEGKHAVPREFINKTIREIREKR